MKGQKLSHGGILTRVLGRFKGINTPAKSSILFTVSNVLGKGAALIFTPFFTRLLTPEEYGTYTLFLSYLSVLLVIGTLEISAGAAMRAFQKFHDTRALTVLSSIIITIPLSLVVSLVFRAIKLNTGGDDLFQGAYLFLFVMMASISVINIFSAKARYLYKPAFSLFLTVIQSIMTPILSISLIGLGALSRIEHVTVKIGVAATANALIALALIFIMIPSVIKERALLKACSVSAWRKTVEILRFILTLAIPLLPYYFCIMAMSQTDKILLSAFHGTDALGKYSISYSAGMAISALTAGLSASLSPWVMRKTRAKNFEEIRTTVSKVTSIICALICAFLALAPDILGILAPAEYHSADRVIFIISICPIPLFISNLMSSISCAKERVGGTVLCGVVPLIISITLCRLLIPRFSLTAAAFSALISYTVLGILSIINAKRAIGALPVPPLKIAFSYLLTALSSLLIYSIRAHTVLRISVFLIAFSVFIFLSFKSLYLVKEKSKNLG